MIKGETTFTFYLFFLFLLCTEFLTEFIRNIKLLNSWFINQILNKFGSYVLWSGSTHHPVYAFFTIFPNCKLYSTSYWKEQLQFILLSIALLCLMKAKVKTLVAKLSHEKLNGIIILINFNFPWQRLDFKQQKVWWIIISTYFSPRKKFP